MRYQGRIIEWNADRGYGFIAPIDGGSRVFVHITSLVSRDTPIVLGEAVSYALAMDKHGRTRADRVEWITNRKGIPRSRSRLRVSELYLWTGVVIFLSWLVVGAASGRHSIVVPAVYLVASAVTFGIYREDKQAAQANRWRISENTLHVLSLAGGWPGGLAAQLRYRHKTSKQSFRRIYWATVVCNCGALGWYLTQ
jgi:uncharacterized membrane protein YsdA (DUF1294 family)/cold shock CspA family protein